MHLMVTSNYLTLRINHSWKKDGLTVTTCTYVKGQHFSKKGIEKGYLFYQKRYIKGQQVYCGLDCHNKKPIVLTSAFSFFLFYASVLFFKIKLLFPQC